MNYSSDDALLAFCNRGKIENWDRPLASLEQALKESGYNYDFYGALIVHNENHSEKIVEVYLDGVFSHKISIEADSPFQAVRDVCRYIKK